MFMAIFVLTAMGLVLGALLGLSAKYLAVDEGNPIIKEIEDLLPNSQCGQCGFPGCSPAAEAIVNGEAEITCCPPGGQPLVEKLARIMSVDLSTLDAKATVPVIASIDSQTCTGCTRCYKACPTDAIVGANKQLHVVIA